MLTQQEIEAIKKEAEELYPDVLIEERGIMELWEMHEHNDMQGYKRDAYITAATSYALRAKGLAEKVTAFMSTIPVDNNNLYLLGFHKSLKELKEAIDNYNQNKEV